LYYQPLYGAFVPRCFKSKGGRSKSHQYKNDHQGLNSLRKCIRLNIRAILFDLHHTLTRTRESPFSMFKRLSEKHGIDTSQYSHENFNMAIIRMDAQMDQFQMERNVSPLWGADPKQWIDFNRRVFESLGILDLSDSTILQIERAWKKEIAEGDYETFTDDAITILKELHARGYILGLVTRRHDNPVKALKKAGVYNLFSTVRWTGVRGYAKPNPYSLIMAADDIGVNPRLCAYVGNWVDADVGAATRAEMVPILVTWADPKEAEKAPKDTIVIESLLELLGMFKGSQVNS